jgi:hypothetical protein
MYGVIINALPSGFPSGVVLPSQLTVPSSLALGFVDRVQTQLSASHSVVVLLNVEKDMRK